LAILSNIYLGPKTITVLATGDVMPGRSVNIQTTKSQDFLWPYAKVFQVLKDADIAFINLETPLISNCPLINEGFKFCGSDKNIQGLLYSGIDVVTLANNHALNFGITGRDSTARLLRESGILATGLSGPVYKTVKGVKIAFLGYNDIGEKQDVQAKNEIEIVRKNADIVIVGYHWGEEYHDKPSTRQIYLAHMAIEAGADVIIGNHPHWIQSTEVFHNKPIIYSHGNFVFDQDWSLKTRQGIVSKFTYVGKKLESVEFLPVQIEHNGQPYFLEGVEKQKILIENNLTTIKF